MDRKLLIQKNLKKIEQDIATYKQVDNVTLVAVTKYGDYSDVERLYELGHRDFGENRVEALEEKQEFVKRLGHSDLRWHFIGNLQSNKIERLMSIENLVAIHSISKFDHLTKISKHQKHPLDIFIQVNTSHEDEKSGLENFEELQEFYERFLESHFQGLILKGLMTMGRIRTEDVALSAKECFSKLSEMKMKLDEGLSLSMGMSSDYIYALENGANYLRIGSTLFKSI
ncbi:YggS family pyridoxal phosphate-dependent enzyme [Bacteriovorax sp. Seq25_V]|uniref:YggS family pyridoxal phosphate-dependent enzyme n=1 Tax=Bacteriovorax sp. Seq25_V TaxID=1201288 RepID=UPI00038A54E8|nr:YggS family pyridoxal phosphate-dependent enzyme [Bacteriovorax sp. Seq25_V]EQC44206.1 pyridoxal phosphate enzyme, YggS family [Bacteriovorax sp. Seq25_V]